MKVFFKVIMNKEEDPAKIVFIDMNDFLFITISFYLRFLNYTKFIYFL
jgi:hypothetical protein